MKFCRECGHENPDEAHFCKNCGFKFETQPADVSMQVVDVKSQTDRNMNPIISKLFYKTDKYTGELRFAKSKSISIVVFAIFFIIAVSANLGDFSIGVVLIVAFFFGLLFALPTYIICYAIGWILDRMCI